MNAPSWPQLRGWAATAAVRTLHGVHSHGEPADFLFEAPDLWWDSAHGGSLQAEHLRTLLHVRLDRDSDRVPARSISAVRHHGRPAWRVELADGTAWVVDDETGLGLRREHPAYTHEVQQLQVDQPLPAALLQQARTARAEQDRRRRLERLVRTSPPPLPRWQPWRWQSSDGHGLVSLDAGTVGRAPLGTPAPLESWIDDDSDVVRMDRAGWSWALHAELPLRRDEAERVVDEVLDQAPPWRQQPSSAARGWTDPQQGSRPSAPGGPPPAPQAGGRPLWEGQLALHYGFYALSSGDDPAGSHTVRGQAQGLMSVAEPGAVRLMAGLHTGGLPLRIELHDHDPGVQDEWEEVVEGSLTSWGDTLLLSAFEQFEQVDLSAGTYRVRLCVIGMDAGHAADTVLSDEAPVEHHRLQLWPEPEERPDELVRLTGQHAAYWHAQT